MSRPGVLFLEARTRSALTNIPSCVGDHECPSPELTSAWTFDGEARGSLSQTRPVGPRHELFGNNGTPVSVFLQQLGRHDVWTCARRKRRLVVCVQGANRCNQPFGARSCALGSPVAEGADGDGSGIWPRSKQRVHVESTVSPGSPVWRRHLQRELCRLALHFEHIDRPCCDCGRHGRPGRPQHGQHRNLRAEARPRVPEQCGRTALVHALCRCLAHWTLSLVCWFQLSGTVCRRACRGAIRCLF